MQPYKILILAQFGGAVSRKLYCSAEATWLTMGSDLWVYLKTHLIACPGY